VATGLELHAALFRNWREVLFLDARKSLPLSGRRHAGQHPKVALHADVPAAAKHGTVSRVAINAAFGAPHR